MIWTPRVRLCAVLITLSVPGMARAEVAGVEVAYRGDVLDGRSFGSAGPYERIAGRIYFSLDPTNERNRVVVDLDKAGKTPAGRVEMSADFAIVRPRDLARGNGIALVDIVNRGRPTILSSFDRAAPTGNLSTEAEVGDGLLLREGYTLVWVGWEFDVPARGGGFRIDVPVASGVEGMARGLFTPNDRNPTVAVGDLAGYQPADASSAANTLSVFDAWPSTAAPATIPRGRWSLSGNMVTLAGGFEAGRTYELAYAAKNPPIAGLGFAAVRDIASWIKYSSEAPASAKNVIAFGSSQSGRFLRTFLYEGFNTDERDRQVFDGVMAHIAGSGRLDLNRRWAVPVTLAMYTGTSFPFADARLKDPVTGTAEGALDNGRAAGHAPKVFYTNTGVEYWGGGRVAALVHTSPDGAKDLTLPDNVRAYFLTGAQHGPSAFPPRVTSGQQLDNPNDYWWTMRALLVAMTRWVRDGEAPPPSRIPRLADGTLVRASKVALPAIPSVESPRALTAGARVANHLMPREAAPGSPLPLLVPQVGKDGNELAGIRLPEVAVPLATYTGWNFRKTSIGAPDQLFPLIGSYVPFPRTRIERDQAGDPRTSIDERYASRDQYLAQVRDVVAGLVKAGYLMAGDGPALIRHAGEHWDAVHRGKSPTP